MHVVRGRGLRLSVAALVAMAALAASAPAALAGECDPVMPASEVEAGMTGTGLTVSRGRTPEPFSVEVLGILPSFVGPGRDVIVVEATSPAIERANGIWFGMSGSPVYIGDRFVGALAYGFSATSRIAGLTPAEDMTKLLTLSARSAGTVQDERIAVPTPLARALAERTGLRASEFQALSRLRVPMSVSGTSAQRLKKADRWITRHDLRVLPFPGAPASREAAPVADPLDPGDNFAAAFSYGDVTIAGYGTTSYVCDGRVLAFGHPFSFLGDLRAGANAATALAIVEDPFWGPFKLAVAAEPIGVFDQDRLAGIRATLGSAPAGTPIRSSVFIPRTGAYRRGETEILTPDLAGMVTYFHVLSNVDSLFDAIRGGTAAVSWTFEGTRGDGTPWRLGRGNLFASRFDIADTASWPIAMEVEMLTGNSAEQVRLTSVDVQASVVEDVRQLTISKVLVAKGRGELRARRSVRVLPGTRLRVRVILQPFGGGPARRVDFRFRVPTRGAPFGVIEIGGGMGGGCEGECEPEGGFGEPGMSFDDVLKTLAKAERNDVLAARLRTGERMRVRQERKVRLDSVVVGGAMIELRPVGGRRGEPVEGP